MTSTFSSSTSRAHAGWYGPPIDLTRRFYILDATEAFPAVGTQLLVHCIPHAGNHRCGLGKQGVCKGGCFYTTLLISRARTRVHDLDLYVTAIQGFLDAELVLMDRHRLANPLILPRGLFVKGELFTNGSSRTSGWLAPPLP